MCIRDSVGAGQHLAIDVESLHEPYHRAALVGKLVGFIHEPSHRALERNGGVLKAITGGDEISARNPCERVFSFQPVTRLVISCNSLPATRDLMHGYFRRLIVIEWRYRPPVPDPELDEKLAAELSGLFNRAMAGLQRYRERGCRFRDLAESERLKAEYRQSQDTAALFLEDVCRRDPQAWVAAAELYRAYGLWCQAKGYRLDQDENAFGQRLTRLGLPKSEQPMRGRGVNQRVRPGLGLDYGALQAVLGPDGWRRFGGVCGPPSSSSCH